MFFSEKGHFRPRFSPRPILGLPCLSPDSVARPRPNMKSLICIVILLSLHAVGGSYNVSVDDSDGRISYSGTGWEGSSQHPSSLDFGGGHSVSTNPGGTASLTFVGANKTSSFSIAFNKCLLSRC